MTNNLSQLKWNYIKTSRKKKQEIVDPNKPDDGDYCTRFGEQLFGKLRFDQAQTPKQSDEPKG